MEEYSTLAGLIVICAAVHSADLGMFGGSIKALEEHFGVDPVSLGFVFLLQGLAQAIAAPFWGILADRHDRIMLLCAVLFGMSALTFITGLINSFSMLCASRMFTGLFSAGLGPVITTMLASAIEPGERSKFFSYLVVATQLGGSAGTVYGASLSHVETLGHQGWRFCAITMSLLTLASGCGLWLSYVPLNKTLHRALVTPTSESRAFEDCRIIFSKASFLLLLCQGAFASTGNAAGNFLIEIFQYAGFNDFDASILVGWSSAGHLVGALSAGYLADLCAKRDPETGRILYGVMGNLCVIAILIAMGIGGVSSILNNRHYFELKVLCFFGGLFPLCAYIGAIKPILSEIVPLRMVGQTYAYAAGIDGAVAALAGAPIVALLSQRVFSYQPTDLMIKDMTEDMRKNNLFALAKAYIAVTSACVVLSTVLFAMLAKTYPTDKSSSCVENRRDSKSNSGRVA